MKKIILIFCLLNSNLSFSQINLVSNPSFEDITDCPANGSEISFAKNWFTANNGTPDLYNKCTPFGGNTYVPNSSQGYQNPRTGDGFSGIITYGTILKESDFTEYIETKLQAKLKKNMLYYASYFVNLTFSIIPCYNDGIGLAFSNKIEKDTNNTIKDRLKAIIHQKGTIIIDTVGWTKISGKYVGNEEEFLTIGNFFKIKDLVIDPTCFNSFPNGSYLFIDDVGVYEFNPLPDTLILCKGQSKRMGGSFLDGKYSWNTGSKDSIINVSKTGRYIMTVRMDDKYDLSDTMYVVNPAEALVSLPRDSSFCKGENLRIVFPNLGTYEWSNGLKNNVFETKSAGIYQTTITNTCGVFKHEIVVKEEDCSCNIFIPTAFSPYNIDGINDVLNCYVKCGFNFKVLRFQIYDRWGSQIYDLSDVQVTEIAWDGTFRGKPCSQGVYTYNIEYEYLKKGKIVKENKSGDFILIQ